jgi:hypothetical protein
VATTKWRVEVTGFREVMDKLKEADKKAYSVIVREITKAGKDVATAASYITPAGNPVSNWGRWATAGSGRDLGYDGSAASGGFKLRRSNYRAKGVSRGIGWSVQQMNAGAAVYELIGDGSRVTTRSGEHLVDTINSRFGVRRPRSLFKAYYEVNTDARIDAIKDQINSEILRLGLR